MKREEIKKLAEDFNNRQRRHPATDYELIEMLVVFGGIVADKATNIDLTLYNEVFHPDKEEPKPVDNAHAEM